MRPWILILFFLLISTQAALGKTYSFSANEEEWGFWGEGMGAHDSRVGHNQPGSLWLSTDWGESHTVHYSWDDLKAGHYKITAFVRAQDVQKGSEGASFWNFYDGGGGITNIFEDLHGHYDWRKISYVVKVEKNKLDLWFRLKAPGQVWMDDLSIEPTYQTTAKPQIEQATHLFMALPIKSQASLPKQSSLIYSFDSKAKEPSHPFTIKKGSGQFSSHEYYNLPVNEILKGQWDNFDRIEMDIYNSDKEFHEFFLTLSDHQSTNYWSQLNHKTHLAPGWNHLSFSLKQFVGERGSHRFKRGLNLKNLTKLFLVVEPEQKTKPATFFIDNLTLVSNPPPEVPADILAFDFTSHKAGNNSHFTPVSSQHLFQNQRGFGFMKPKFWRVEDSVYTCELLRYTIGILDGHFMVKVPNGKYQFQLIIDKLGYWDVPFWKGRQVNVNGRPVFSSARSQAVDYVNDLLRFEAIDPKISDSPYDLYLSKIFKPITHTVEVKNGLLDFEFTGDPSGVSLNSLIIWPVLKKKEADKFLKAVEARNREEFHWISRQIKTPNLAISPRPTMNVVQPDLMMNPKGQRPALKKNLTFSGGRLERPYQVLEFQSSKQSGELSWTVSDLVSTKGDTISSQELLINDVKFQYTSPDLNHETYMLVGKYLRPLKDGLMRFQPQETRYLWLQFPLTHKMKPGKYQGSLTFIAGESSFHFPIQVDVKNYELPKVNFPVGFFGLDPIPATYFEGHQIDRVRSHYRLQLLDQIAQAGFTTFSGLPKSSLIIEGDLARLETTDLDELFSAAKNLGMDQPVFSYGGQFPQTLIDGSQKPWDMDAGVYRRKLAEVLSETFSQKPWPKIVHTFSDEAGGYSDKVAQDLALGEQLKKDFPFMSLGGFGNLNDPATEKLNKFFDYGFYSHVIKSKTKTLASRKWGTYNGSPGNLHDPRFSFGLGLFAARKAGLSHYLEWHATGFNNYPYYELDGRESDITMFMPSQDGNVYPTIRFELATEGLNTFRKLKLLEDFLVKNKDRSPNTEKVQKWLNDLIGRHDFFSTTAYLQKRNENFEQFNSELNQHLDLIYK